MTQTHDAAAASGGEVNEEAPPRSVSEAAHSYRERQWSPLPLRRRSKEPVAKDWAHATVDSAALWPGNIGVRLGGPSRGLVDIDLDCAEALLLAPAILPPTGAVFGRPGAPAAHWLYDCGAEAPAKASTGPQFATGFGEKGEKDKPLVELRSTGGQTMFPTSVHPNGEQLAWARYGVPGKVGSADLLRATAVLAAASLLLRHFPDEGGRFHGYAALIGTLLRCELSSDTVESIVAVFVQQFGSPARPREQSVRALQQRLSSGDGTVPGFPRLAEVFGAAVARRCKDWLRSNEDWRRHPKSGAILPNAVENLRLALDRLEVSLRHDEFADRLLVRIGEGREDPLDDNLGNRLWFNVEESFGFSPSPEKFYAFLRDTAWQNRFHPVRDYLASLKWDGRKRLDTWLFEYGGIASRPDEAYVAYVRAVGRIMLVAAVRRVREPGAKFDEMLVLINEEQGTGKSSALAILARQPDWFTDSVDFAMKDKEVIEQMQGKWIAEIPELRGRKKDIDHIKAFLSRQRDRARLAYARLRTEVGRSFVLFGTANDTQFLIDSTGNRRFWPVIGANFDLEALTRDADQLWAEAAVAEAEGESIRLPRELWKVAAQVQSESLIEDPWVEVLREALDGWEGKIRSGSILQLLGVDPQRRSQFDNERMGHAMRQLGWRRAESPLRFDTGTGRGYIKGDGIREVFVSPDADNRALFILRLGQPPAKGEERWVSGGVRMCTPNF
ncbi:MAG: bifunctional DNA primase/polymerase [Alphaproteobacteria bacterium]|nr:bifunctional DNA primase/polymerase [Alphaproteobacteria bacterium]